LVKLKVLPRASLIWLYILVISLALVLPIFGFQSQNAFAEHGSYTINITAADPAVNHAPYLPTYVKLTPGGLSPPSWNPAPSGGTGRASDPLPNAIYGNPQDSVTSLTPASMVLGQIVPFEVRIKVNGSTTPENGTIIFTPYFSTKTTGAAPNNGFGYDPAYGIYTAFVDTADTAKVNGTTAKVDSYSTTIVNPGTATEQIRGQIRVSGLQNGDTVIVEVWVVLKASIPLGTTGNVESGLVSARTVATESEDITINEQKVTLSGVGAFFTASADVSIAKTDSPDPVTRGQQITYTIVVTNTSATTTANGVVVTDTLDANTTFVSASGAPFIQSGNTVTFTVGGLNPLQSISLQVIVTVSVSAPTENDPSSNPEPGSATLPTNFDINNKAVVSTILVDPNAAKTYYQPTNVKPVANPSLSVAKSGTLNSGTISYTFTVTNTGNINLTNVIVTDAKVPVISPASVATLAPGASAIFTGSYTLTQADLDKGHVDNTATATSNESPPAHADAFVVVIQAGGINIQKSGTLNLGTNGIANPGDIITYTFTVTNTGNVTLTSVIVTDTEVTGISPASATLAPGASTTFTAIHTLTQADINAASVIDTATATGTPPSGPNVTDTSTDTVNIPQVPSISIAKNGSLNLGADGIANPGDVISYTFTVTNTGNVTLTSVNVTDTKVTSSILPASATLAPGASTTFSGSYTLIQADINTGSVVNTATATGTPPIIGPNTTSQGSTTVAITQVPSLSVVKTGSLVTNVVTPNDVANVGDRIDYTIAVTNNGNITLTGVSATDPLIATLTPIFWPGTAGTLLPGQSVQFTGSYTLTQADLDKGHVSNTTTATSNQSPPAHADAFVVVTQAAGLNIQKSGTLNLGTNGIANPGDIITYTFTVTNTGNVTLTSVIVTDTEVTGISPASATLAPGASTTFTAIHTLTQADINAASVVDTATATGTPPSGPNVTDTSTDTVNVPQRPSISIVKNGSLNLGQDGIANPGDVISYTFTVTNTGNVTLTSVIVTDTEVTGISPVSVPTLAPAAGTTFTANHTLTQADINTGSVVNTATATGTPPFFPNVTDTSTDTVNVPQLPSLSVTKAGSLNLGANGIADPGDTITYTITVTNTGNVTLTGVSATDPIIATLTPNWPPGGTAGTLLPGQSVQFTGSYTLTQADLDKGHVSNTTTATSNQSAPAHADVFVIVMITVPGLNIQKSGTLNLGTNGIANPGDIITYTFTVTNTGNVTLTSVIVTDTEVTGISPASATLAPGASTTFSANHTLTQADIDTGRVINTATATGTPPGSPNVTDASTETVNIPQVPSLAIVKAGIPDKTVVSPPGAFNVGDKINYTITVTNTGNVTLTGVSITDPIIVTLTPNWPGTAGTLLPGQSATFTGSYTLTQADIDKGHRDNRANVTSNQSPSAHADAFVIVTTAADINIQPVQTQIQIQIPAPIPIPKNIDTSSPYSLPDRLVTSPANMVVTNLNVQPQQAQAIQPVTIYANIANRGDESGSYTATLKINGQIEETRTGRVGGRTAVPLQFVVSKDKPGTYTVDINGQQASFTILDDGGNKFGTAAINWSLVVFILCSIIAIILLGLLIRRRLADY
jgi:uncharacterized repeat protein (TIGR01451 family)